MKSIYGKRNTFNIPSNLSDIDHSRYLSRKVIESDEFNKYLNVNNSRVN